jgi:hypothetical protein
MITEEEQKVRDLDYPKMNLDLKKIKEVEEVKEEVEEIEGQIDLLVVLIIRLMGLIEMDLILVDLKLKMMEKLSQVEDSGVEAEEIEEAIPEVETHKNKNEKFTEKHPIIG